MIRMKKILLMGLIVVSSTLFVGCDEDPFYNERHLIKKGVTKKTWFDICPECRSSNAVKITLENQVVVKECEKSSCSFYIRGELNETIPEAKTKEGEE